MAPVTPLVSVIVPCFNEEQGLPACHERLTAVLTRLAEPYEILYIDDGSKDKTVPVLRSLQANDAHIVLLRLSRNFGHQPAVSAGLDAAHGDCVIIIDADLQDPPELIPEMIRLWREGYDVVYGVRESPSIA
jgi:dolichol-phosphate mannosyltransferase